jgi:hypothetical protein
MLGNPAERAHSKWKWMHQYGYEKIPSFVDALTAEDRCRFENEDFKKNHGQYYYNFLYFRSGLYYGQVKRFFDTFGRERVHIVIFEEFSRATVVAVQQVYAFLGVDSRFEPQIEIHNPTSAKHQPFDPALRQALLEKYSEDTSRLEQLLQRDLKSLWK